MENIIANVLPKYRVACFRKQLDIGGGNVKDKITEIAEIVNITSNLKRIKLIP